VNLSLYNWSDFKGSLYAKSRAFADSGYQGLDKLHAETELPYKETKTKPLDREEKEYNKALSRVRITIENIFGDIKTFKILADRYRNKRKRYNVKFKIIAGIVNLKNGFAVA
jgi:transposase